MVLGDQPVLHQHRGPNPRPQVVGDVGGHGVEVGLHGGPAGFEQLGHVHEQLVDHRPQPSGGQLPGPGPPRRGPGAHLLGSAAAAAARAARAGSAAPAAAGRAGRTRRAGPASAVAASGTDPPVREPGPVPTGTGAPVDLVPGQPGQRADLVQPVDLVPRNRRRAGRPAGRRPRPAARSGRRRAARAGRAPGRRRSGAAPGVAAARRCARRASRRAARPAPGTWGGRAGAARTPRPRPPGPRRRRRPARSSERQVVELERVRGVRPAAALDGGQHPLAVAVGVEAAAIDVSSRRRCLPSWSRSRATSACESVAPVVAVSTSGRPASTWNAVTCSTPSKPISNVTRTSLPSS